MFTGTNFSSYYASKLEACNLVDTWSLHNICAEANKRRAVYFKLAVVLQKGLLAAHVAEYVPDATSEAYMVHSEPFTWSDGDLDDMNELPREVTVPLLLAACFAFRRLYERLAENGNPIIAIEPVGKAGYRIRLYDVVDLETARHYTLSNNASLDAGLIVKQAVTRS